MRIPFPKGVEIVVSADKTKNPRDLRPDIGMRIPLEHSRQQHRRHAYIEAPFDDISTALCFELKYNNSDDPFDDFEPTDSDPISLFEASSTGARSTRGQLAMYADRQFKHQPVLFLFQVVLTGCFARLLYWDRSGATVTKAFNILEQPEVLVDFLWRFAHATERERGWDESVVVASRSEQRQFADAVRIFGAQGNDNVPPGLAAELDSETRSESYPVLKVRVPMDFVADRSVAGNGDQYREYLIRRPFYSTCSTPGRGTRGYLAYDVRDGVFRFLKDTWCSSHSASLQEAEAYRLLKQRQVPHVLLPLRCGLVRGSDGIVHSTKNHTFATKTGEDRSSYARGYSHARLVQDIACDLRGLRNSKELVQVLLHITKCKPSVDFCFVTVLELSHPIRYRTSACSQSYAPRYHVL